MMINKKWNITLILLLIGLISSMGTVNASDTDIYDPYYSITSYDVTVKQGETATIKARLYYNDFQLNNWGISYYHQFCPDSLLLFTLKDKKGHVLVEQIARTGKEGWFYDEPAICKIDTSGIPLGKYKLTITYYNFKKGIPKIVTKQYNFNVI